MISSISRLFARKEKSSFFWSSPPGHLANLQGDAPEEFRYLSLHVHTPMPNLLAISCNAIDIQKGREGAWKFRFNIPNTQKTFETLLRPGLRKGAGNE
ncbi:MAG: hypothetical protein M0O96_07620 [Desulforhopalus sp.]|nr:hypothetical protein [Desulforhopalus sp.]